jgi:histidinol phosphatase-like PHP family hydrolase
MYSNLRTLDCVSKPIEYINRAKELGHTTYFTTEHGYQGNVFEANELLKQIANSDSHYAYRAQDILDKL